ncbi:MAG: response regulator [Methanoregula sp.]
MAGKGKILLMDDEQIIVDVTQEVLKFLEYDVMFAENGSDAIDLYKQEKEAGVPFDAVILDLSIPNGMGGKEAIQKLREYDPAVKAIISSGYSSDPVVLDFKGYGFSGVLSKPYKINDVKMILDQLLNQ